jgi:hypothetical protein
MNILPIEIIESILEFVPFGGTSWLSCLLVSKDWLATGQRVFDPSVKNNRAIRWAAEAGKLEAVL